MNNHFLNFRRNCKGNPNCLVGIGEQAWLGEIDENTFHNIDDPNSERRDKVFSRVNMVPDVLISLKQNFCHYIL